MVEGPGQLHPSPDRCSSLTPDTAVISPQDPTLVTAGSHGLPGTPRLILEYSSVSGPPVPWFPWRPTPNGLNRQGRGFSKACMQASADVSIPILRGS